MKKNRILLILTAILIATLLASCGSTLTGTSWPGISASDDLVYVANSAFVYAVRISDGTQAWRYPEKAGRVMFFAAPVKADGILVVGDYTNTLHALDPITGAEKWSFADAKGRWIASPLIVDDKILAPNGDHHLYALDLNGNLLWKFKTGQALWSQPVSDGTYVYQASLDHFLYAVDLKTGQEAWSADLGGAVIYSPMLAEDGLLYISTLGRELVAVDSATGKEAWARKFDETIWGQPAMNEGVLFLGDLTGKIYGVKAEDGSEVWTQAINEPVTGAPTIVDGAVIFPTESGQLIAVGFDGERLWSKSFEGKLYNGPVVVGDRLAVGITQGKTFLQLINLQGQDVWSFAPPK